MRIRSIKPEFWTDGKINTVSDSAKLMAIALLNYADDEGYFLADPRLVRSSCRPFDDDSTKSKRAIDELSKIGYITLYDAGECGPVGYIQNFLKHQKIDRPSESKLKTYIDSTNPRRILDEPSTPEQGTGNREKDMEQVGDFPFEKFWDHYDKKVGEKDKIRGKYEKLPEEIRAKIFDHVTRYKQSQPDKQYRKNPETYLNSKGWNDEIIKPKPNGFRNEPAPVIYRKVEPDVRPQ